MQVYQDVSISDVNQCWCVSGVSRPFTVGQIAFFICDAPCRLADADRCVKSGQGRGERSGKRAAVEG